MMLRKEISLAKLFDHVEIQCRVYFKEGEDLPWIENIKAMDKDYM